LWEAQPPILFLLIFSYFYDNLMFMQSKNKKVVCALSGGIDSSVAAALLKKQGYDVIGIFMLMHKNAKPKDAKKVAKKLNIPFHVLNVQKEFKKKVIDYFIEEYRRGRTPNPCIECNRFIKFKFLLDEMVKLNAQYIATGHYAKTKLVNSKQICYSLITAKDKSKGQSYFLWTLTQKQLKKVLFPIGDYTKKEVREMAKRWNLPVFGEKESQEICFIPHSNTRRFLESRIRAGKGPIITIKGKKVGEHKGLVFYTIGQRKGIGVGGIGPFYVVDKNFKDNVLIVAESDYVPELYKREMIIEKANWISGKNPKLPLKCRVKIRYLAKAASCVVYKAPVNRVSEQKTKYKIQFSAPQRAITSGQSAVFYLRNEVLGGGIIC